MGEHRLPCSAPWDGAAIHFSGDVFPCPTVCHRDCAGSLKLGTLRETGLAEILRGPRAQTLRERLLAGDLEGLCCQHCNRLDICNLYGDPVVGEASRPPERHVGWDTGRRDTEPQPLQRLEICLTDRCNLRCEMCLLAHGRVASRGLETGGHLTPELLAACLDALDGRLPHASTVDVYLHWIGEPLLHPEFANVARRLAEVGDHVQLGVVTNAVSLDGSLTDRLLALPGHHNLSVSLNALAADTYRRVNGRAHRDRVYGNVEHFLAERRRRRCRERWSVGVSCVVLANNLDEIPEFVRHWKARFRPDGPSCSLSLNGKGSLTPERIFLLTEVDRPESRALFRETLRRLKIQDPGWPTEPHRALDALVLATLRGAPLPTEIPRLEADPDPRELEAVVESLYAAGAPDRARQVVARLLAAPGADPRPLLHLHRHRDHDAVVELASELLSRRPSEPYALWIRGAARGALGETVAALRDLEACLAGGGIEGFADAVHDSLATVYRQGNALDLAIDHARQALEIAPHKRQTRELLE